MVESCNRVYSGRVMKLEEERSSDARAQNILYVKVVDFVMVSEEQSSLMRYD